MVSLCVRYHINTRLDPANHSFQLITPTAILLFDQELSSSSMKF